MRERIKQKRQRERERERERESKRENELVECGGVCSGNVVGMFFGSGAASAVVVLMAASACKPLGQV